MFLHDTVLNADFTRRYNAFSLAFKSPLCCDGDTIWINVMSDSLNVDKRTFSLYAYFPRNINPINSSMLLNYTDGTFEILYQPGFPDEDNYVEYYIASKIALDVAFVLDLAGSPFCLASTALLAVFSNSVIAFVLPLASTALNRS